MEYDIDVRRYITAVLSRWRWIVIGALLAALAAAAFSITRPVAYRTTASVVAVIRETGSQVSGDEDLLTIESIDVSSRRSALVVLGTNPVVETQLPPDVLERVAPDNYEPGMLIETKQIIAYPAGDLIVFEASANTPEQAKQLADAWASTYLNVVAPLYTDEFSDLRLVGESVLPYKPASRGTLRNVLLAGTAGAVLGLGAAFLSTAVAGRAASRRRPEIDSSVVRPSPSR